MKPKVTCPRCKGTGRNRNHNDCSACGGRGYTGGAHKPNPWRNQMKMFYKPVEPLHSPKAVNER